MITSIWQLRGEAKAMEYAASFNSQLPLYTASEWEAIEAVRSGRKTDRGSFTFHSIAAGKAKSRSIRNFSQRR